MRNLYIDPPGSTSRETVETVSFIRAPASTPLKQGVNESEAADDRIRASSGSRISGFLRVSDFGPRISRRRAVRSKRFARQFACD
jgi:hypothetical protein